MIDLGSNNKTKTSTESNPINSVGKLFLVAFSISLLSIVCVVSDIGSIGSINIVKIIDDSPKQMFRSDTNTTYKTSHDASAENRSKISAAHPTTNEIRQNNNNNNGQGQEQQPHDHRQQQQEKQQQQQQQKQHTNSPSRTTVVDIMSVGSNLEEELQRMKAQRATFGSHALVRRFQTTTEFDDHESKCHTDLTIPAVKHISSVCRTQYTEHPELMKMRSRFAVWTYLEKKGAAASGWLCAQKRLPESLYKALQDYVKTATTTTSVIPPPDYLFLLDADTYLNMDNIFGKKDPFNDGLVPTKYPSNETMVVAGCLVRERVMEHNFTFPWGGFGTIFTKPSIERFVQPIGDCDAYNFTSDRSLLLDPETNARLSTLSHRPLTDSEFERLVCAKLTEDLIGEEALFRNGMSVADLMYQYVTHWKYVDADVHWKENQIVLGKNGENKKTTGGFCMHSDWVIGYFVNHYYLSSFDGEIEYFKDNPENRLAGYDGSEFYAGKRTKANYKARKQCLNDYDHACDPQTAHICHHVSPKKMQELAT